MFIEFEIYMKFFNCLWQQLDSRDDFFGKIGVWLLMLKMHVQIIINVCWKHNINMNLNFAFSYV